MTMDRVQRVNNFKSGTPLSDFYSTPLS